MFPRIALFPLFSAGLIWAQMQLQFPFSFSPGAAYTALLPSVNGEPLLIGSQPGYSPYGTPRRAIALAAIGATPFQNGIPPENLPVLGGTGNDQPLAAAVDPQGNIWIVGSTNSDDFNLVNPIMSQKVPYRTAGFVIELDSTGANLLFASYLCGHQAAASGVAGKIESVANQIVFDSSGNAYVAGTTDEQDFPVTPGAFQSPGAPGIGDPNYGGETYFYAFITKISPAGKLVFSALLGSDEGSCVGGSSCINGDSTSTNVDGLSVDASGNVTLSGITNSPGFPVTPGAVQQECDCAYPDAAGFVSRLSPDASKLVWSTYAGSASFGAIGYLGMAEDAQGNVDLFGQYALYLPVPGPPAVTGSPGLFAAKLSSDGSQLIFSTDLGQSLDAAAHGIALDPLGNVYFAGTSSFAQFPSLPDVPNVGADFVLQLAPPNSQPQALVRLPTGTIGGPPVLDASPNLLLIAAQTALLQLAAGLAVSAPAVVGFSNSASFALETGLYPGALISLFGFDFASAGQIAALDASGKFPTTLESVQVLMNGVAAPLLYVGPNQINLQVPFEVEPPVQLQVILPTGTLTASLAVSSALGLFTSNAGWAAALNQDGTVNSSSNPAQPGSIVSLFGTGGTWPSGLADGALASGAAPLSQETNDFQVVDEAGISVNILYAGAAPGLIDGVFQLNVQLPSGEGPNPTLILKSGASAGPPSSNPVQIYSQ
jgi:uncharacterized protein (TIGR03437 family)